MYIILIVIKLECVHFYYMYFQSCSFLTIIFCTWLNNISLTADVKCCCCSIVNCYQFLCKFVVGESTGMLTVTTLEPCFQSCWTLYQPCCTINLLSYCEQYHSENKGYIHKLAYRSIHE